MNNDKEEFNNTSQSTEFGWSLIEGTEIYLFRVYDFFLNSFWWVRFFPSLPRSNTSAYNNTSSFKQQRIFKECFRFFRKRYSSSFRIKEYLRFISSFGLLVVVK